MNTNTQLKEIVKRYCVCVYIHIYICIYTERYGWKAIQTSLYHRLYVYTYICTLYICVYIYIYIYIYIFLADTRMSKSWNTQFGRRNGLFAAQFFRRLTTWHKILTTWHNTLTTDTTYWLQEVWNWPIHSWSNYPRNWPLNNNILITGSMKLAYSFVVKLPKKLTT